MANKVVLNLDKYKACFQRGAENVKDGLTLEQMKEQQTSWGKAVLSSGLAWLVFHLPR